MDKKVALVTGSARGIGQAIAKGLLTKGYYVFFSDILQEEEGKGILDSPGKASLSCDYIKCDISLEKDRIKVFEKIIKKTGRLDLLVNNAGVAPLVRKDILEMPEESYDRVMNINLKGTFFMCQKAARVMMDCLSKGMEDYSPRIINISSISSYTSSVSRGEYCISKAGVSMVTALFADRLAEEGIPVFEIRPGIILTDMTNLVKEKYERLIGEGLTPIKRFGKPEDVANLVLAVCSGLMDFTTGQVLNADGGFHLRRL